jgi:hypothetical protein
MREDQIYDVDEIRKMHEFSAGWKEVVKWCEDEIDEIKNSLLVEECQELRWKAWGIQAVLDGVDNFLKKEE